MLCLQAFCWPHIDPLLSAGTKRSSGLCVAAGLGGMQPRSRAWCHQAVLGLIWQPDFTMALQLAGSFPPAGEERVPQVVLGSGELLEGVLMVEMLLGRTFRRARGGMLLPLDASVDADAEKVGLCRTGLTLAGILADTLTGSRFRH